MRKILLTLLIVSFAVGVGVVSWASYAQHDNAYRVSRAAELGKKPVLQKQVPLHSSTLIIPTCSGEHNQELGSQSKSSFQPSTSTAPAVPRLLSVSIRR